MMDIHKMIDEVMENDTDIQSDWDVLTIDCPDCGECKVWREKNNTFAQCFHCGCYFNPGNRSERF